MEERLIEKIKKLFALANNEGAAPNEAENALRMANKLMEKHNLSSIDLHNKEDLTIKFEDGTRNQWARQIYASVAKVYSCGCFRQGSEQMLLVGTVSDTMTASIVANGLIDNINRAGKGKGVAFKNGAMFEVLGQCERIIQERADNREVIPGHGLVLADVYKSKADRVREYMDTNLNLSTSRASRLNSSDEGREYGRTLNPHAQVGGGQKSLN